MNIPLSFLFNQIVWTMNKHADKILKREFEVTFKQFLMMATLSNIQPTTQHHLAQCLEYSDAAVSRMVNKLATSGYLTIKRDPSHLKKRVVALKDTGLKMVRDASKLLETEFLKSVEDTGVNGRVLHADLVRINDKLKEKNI